MFVKREEELQGIMGKFNYESFRDLSLLTKQEDAFKKLVVVGLVKKMFCNYSLINETVAYKVANLIGECCAIYEEESVQKVTDCFSEKIGERTYAVGVQTFISRMESIVKGSEM